MTNLEIIKYLATNNPTRLAELFDDIYNDAYIEGYHDDWDAKPDFVKWLSDDSSKLSLYYNKDELEEWSKVINNPSIEITYPDNLVIELPWEGKDHNHMWNTDNNFNIISKALEEMELLANIIESEEYPDSVYSSFRKEVCAGCNDPNCLKSTVEIYDCDKFASWL